LFNNNNNNNNNVIYEIMGEKSEMKLT